MDRLDGDAGLSVGILTGAGGSFCAGMDLKAFARGENVVVEGRGMGFTERPPVKPLIAAVEGYALAGGMELALATDLIVASKDSAFGIPEVKRGLVAGGGGLLRLPQRIPYAIAMELALTGDNLPAERAHELGLVNVLAEPGSALDAAIALAEKITANGPLAVAATKRIIVESRGWSPEEMWAKQTKILMPVFSVQRRQGRRGGLRRKAAAEVDRHLTLEEWRRLPTRRTANRPAVRAFLLGADGDSLANGRPRTALPLPPVDRTRPPATPSGWAPSLTAVNRRGQRLARPRRFAGLAGRSRDAGPSGYLHIPRGLAALEAGDPGAPANSVSAHRDRRAIR